jgi:GNAT superfamily N-acetyltransferase
MQIEVKEIHSLADIKKFVKFPHKLYKNNSSYVPVLDSGELNTLTKSPSLDYCKIRMWLAYSSEGEIVGRVAGILNPRVNEFQGTSRIRFGWFDFVEDPEVARALLNKVEEWGREENMAEIHGPLGYNTWNRQGILIEGFENTPPSNCLYNYPYYPQFMNELNFSKQVDWIQIKLIANVGVPEKLKRLNELLLKKYNLKVLDVKRFKNNEKMLLDFFKSYNESFREIDNFAPLTVAEVQKIGREYIPMLKPELTCILVDENNSIAAFAVCFPSLSEALKKAKGRLYPFGFRHLLRSFRKYDSIDLMLLGAAPEWQNKGISSIIHTYLATRFKELNLKYAITNPQAEDNSVYKVWEMYEHEPFMKRRCYIKSL